MQKKTWLYCMLMVLVMIPQMLCAHSNKNEHIKDMYNVFGFVRNPQLTEWMEFITSDMIDKQDFHNILYDRHPGFTCRGPKYHRLLFHWGYNGEPWSDALESRVRAYGRLYKLNQDSIINVFKKEIQEEQKRRNAIMNRKTEDLFGFGHIGQGASRANFFISLAYDIHLIGDYTPDNTELKGLQDFEKIVDDIAKRITTIDSRYGGAIAKEIKRIARSGGHVSNKAEKVLSYLSCALPDFIINAQGGALYKALCQKGFYINSVSAAIAA